MKRFIFKIINFIKYGNNAKHFVISPSTKFFVVKNISKYFVVGNSTKIIEKYNIDLTYWRNNNDNRI